MSKLSLVFALSLIASASFASERGIPYALSCVGDLVYPVAGKITLNTQTSKEGLKLVRTYQYPDGSPVSPAVAFQVQAIGPKDRWFLVETVGPVLFAGSGSWTGVLSFNPESGVGSWGKPMLLLVKLPECRARAARRGLCTAIWPNK